MGINFFLLKSWIRYRCLAGNEHDLHSPFLYNLYCSVFKDKGHYYDFDALQRQRHELRNNHEKFEALDLGAGSVALKNKRTISEVVQYGITSEKYARLLFRLVNFLRPKVILELGTSVGLTTEYLHAGNKEAKLYSIEGDPFLAAFARERFIRKKIISVEVIQGNFDTVLEEVLIKLPQLDFALIDGNHRKEPTLRYFSLLAEKCHPNSLLIFDDIYWSKEMAEAWSEIKNNPRVRMTIDCFQFGMVFFKEEFREKQHFILKF